MEQIQDWATDFLLEHRSTLQTLLPYLNQARRLTTTATTSLYTLVDQAARKPDLTTVALLLVILFVSLKLLDMLWRQMLFWLRVARKLIVYGGLAALAVWMYTRGPDGVLADVQYWVQVWNDEHGYWKERERMARLGKGLKGSAGAGRGAGSGGAGWPWS